MLRQVWVVVRLTFKALLTDGIKKEVGSDIDSESPPR